MKKINYLVLIIATFCTQGLFLQKGLSQLSEPSLKEKYRFAIQDAALVEPNKIVDNLIPITPDNNLIVWDENKTKVLVVTWKSQSNYEQYIKPNSNTSGNEDRVIWVTAAPQVKEFCQQYLKNHPQATEEDLKLRLKQYLGLDPDWKYDLFVEMWVSPQDIFRPCVNPDITKRDCQLDFEAVTPKVAGISNGSGIKDYQLFYQNLYFKSIRRAMQPWTGLGYTYDWGDSVNHVGASEFILVPGAAYNIKQAVPTMNYCQSSVH
jgi:hypothetical protein